jgi:SAM-dependent methyltransferase
VSREQRFVFDEVAELYERARPEYPKPLVDDVLAYAGLGEGDRALEIGAGTGKASTAFAARALDLTCLEPGAGMATLLRRKLARFARARVIESTFESFANPGAPFDLVFAAQSFHWVDPARRLDLAANALRPEGTLAVFGNLPFPGEGSLHDAIQRAYAAFAPGLAARVPGSGASRDGIPIEEQITRAGAFRDFSPRRYAWSRAYTAPDYVALMQTQSNHRLLEPDALSALLDGIASAIAAHGGQVEVRYEARLMLARRR